MRLYWRYDNVSGMVSFGMQRIRNRKLSKAISDLGWRQFRTLTENKCAKYGRIFKVINRWEPTSQKCSVCGFKGGKKELDVREWTCLNCGTVHDRDVNAAVNILEAGTETVVEETVEPQPITKVEETVENPVQLSLFVSVAPPQEAIVAGGHLETQNKTRSQRKSRRKKRVASDDVSTRPESFKQLSLFD